MSATVSPDIPVLDLRPQLEQLRAELDAALGRVLESGTFVLGPEVEAFEGEAARYLGVKHAVGLNSGTDALVIGLRALGIGLGDEVITTPFSFFATAEAISTVGAKPVFVDIDPVTFNLEPDGIPPAITEQTKAIMPVHLFGLPAAMTQIRAIAKKHGLRIIEDAAQSFGATLEGKQTGSLGDVGAFSFYPTKNLGALGDGGLLTTDDDAVAQRARALRNHGSSKRYHHDTLGYNSRLDALQAAVLRVKLPYLAGWNKQRREVAKRYNDLLESVVVTPALSAGHVFHQYTVRLPAKRRDEVQQSLQAQGVGTTIYYPVPQHCTSVYARTAQAYPHAERAAREVLSLPIWPELGAAQQRRVATALRQALG